MYSQMCSELAIVIILKTLYNTFNYVPSNTIMNTLVIKTIVYIKL